MTSWDPLLDLVGDRTVLKVSATDASSTSSCGLCMALKTRPDVKSPSWGRSFPPRSAPNLFPLGDLVDLLTAAHQAPEMATYTEQHRWLVTELDKLGVRRLLRPYLESAFENIIDLHEETETKIGRLRWLSNKPTVGARPRQLWAWAPLYETDEGVREIRRYRVGSAHIDQSESDTLWVRTAAYVAARFRTSISPSRIRVVEIGPADGSMTVAFDDEPSVAVASFELNDRERIADMTAKTHTTPCSSCGDCKVAGVCEALTPLNGMLGQSRPGYQSRSVAPSGLDTYRRCPAEWLLDNELHFPRANGSSTEQARGRAVHRWLEVAHKREVGCNLTDLPIPGGELGIASEILTEDEYALAYPYLVQHASGCPISYPDSTFVAAEKNVYGFDQVANVVPVTKPDLMYRRGSQLIVREFKTSASPPANGKDEAYSQHFQVPFLLTMLASGLTEAYGAKTGVVELEFLTPEHSEVWRWDTDNELTVRVAAGDVREAVNDWHTDGEWKTRIGPHCSWCPVRTWCPDRDAYEAGPSSSIKDHEEVNARPRDLDDLPPF